MATLFYNEKYVHQFPVTYMFLERLDVYLKDAPQDSSVIAQAIVKALESEGIPVKTGEVITYVVDRMESRAKSADEEEKEATSGKKSSFGAEYLKWAGGLDGEQVCMFIAKGDCDYARRLYCEVDFEIVEGFAKHCFERAWQEAVMQFEAAAYGFGGESGDDDKDNVPVKGMDASELNSMMRTM